MQASFSKPWIGGSDVHDLHGMLGQCHCGLVRKTRHPFTSRQFIICGFSLLLILLSTTWCSSPTLAQVPRIQGQGAAASGMGNAFAAQADNPSALHYNPAGMTQLRGVQIMAGGLLSAGR